MKNKPVLFKVVGTSFRPLPPNKTIQIEGSPYEVDGVPTAIAQAILAPEPTNEYDPNAVQVIVKLNTGEAFTIGYIGKDDPWQAKIQRPTLAKVRISDYSRTGNYNPSYNVIDVQM